MFLTLKNFSNVKSLDDAVKKIETGLIPTLVNMPGFINFYAMRLENGDLGSVSLFKQKADANKANESITAWTKKELSAHLLSDPVVLSGEVLANAAERAAAKTA